MKRCAKCNNDYDLIQFPKDSSNKDGYKSYCFPCNREVSKKSTLKRKDKRHDENIKNRENISKYNKSYYNNNKIIFQQNYKKYLQLNPTFRVIHNTRVRINKALKLNLKYSSTEELLGCTIQEYKLYLEQQFTSEMNWDNYGSYWEIDHIIPCASFNLYNLEEQNKCFIFTNTRPLTKLENQIKNKY
jgi:hypothetical protein